MTQSFDDFVVMRGPALYRLAYVLAGDQHTAQDLVQDALVKTQRHWRSVVAAADNPDAYARRVLINQHLSWRRRWQQRFVRLTHDGLLPETGTPDSAAAIGVRDALWSALATLPPRQRAVLVLRYLADRPDAEVAAVLGCSEATVRSQASRGLAALRGRMTVDLDLIEEIRHDRP